MINNPLISSKDEVILISGPCAVESEVQLRSILQTASSPRLIRGGIYKMRTSAKSFQGMGNDALKMIENLKEQQPFE